MSPRWTRFAGAGVAATLAAVVGLGTLTAAAGSEPKSVALDGAESARVEIELDAGELKLHGGAPSTDLLSGMFDYEASSGEPEFEYAVVDGVGELKVEPEGNGFDFDWPWDMVDDNKWDVCLNDTLPTELKVDVDAGNLELALGGMAVTNLEVDVDAARAEVDLSGEWGQNLTADLKADAGQLSIIVPTGVGVRIETDVDAGDKDIDGLTEIEDNVYVNAEYATSAVKLDIKADVDAGQLKVEVAA
jgi:hypothetical protein